MKRSITLILTGGLTAIIVTIIVILALSNLISPTQASGGDTGETSLLAPVNVEATAQALQYQNRQADMETAFQQREAVLQAEINQKQQTIANLDQTSPAEITRLQNQLKDLNSQVAQKTTQIETMQTHLAELQQTIENDDVTFQNEVTRLQNAEQQLQQQLETVYAQLETAYNALAQQQATAANNAPGLSGSSQAGGGSNYEDHGNDDHDNDDHDDHHDDHEDDDD